MALSAAEKIREIIGRTAIAVVGRSVHVTASGGIATFENNNFDSAADLTAAADDALAKAKKTGRSRCEAAP